jgi:hypothetical protein
MVYVLNKNNNLIVFYDESLLSEEDKKTCIIFKDLPVEEDKEGYYKILELDEKNKLNWKYIKIIKEETTTPKE